MDDGVELRRLARDIGYELARNRPDVLDNFRASASRVQAAGATPFVLGYRAALVDTVAAYRDAIASTQNEQMAEELGRRRGLLPVLRALADGPKRVGEIARLLQVDQSHISRMLSEMRSAGLAAVWPLPGQDARTRPHRLTMLGESVARKLASQSLEPEPSVTHAQVAVRPTILRSIEDIVRSTVREELRRYPLPPRQRAFVYVGGRHRWDMTAATGIQNLIGPHRLIELPMLYRQNDKTLVTANLPTAPGLWHGLFDQRMEITNAVATAQTGR